MERRGQREGRASIVARFGGHDFGDDHGGQLGSCAASSRFAGSATANTAVGVVQFVRLRPR